VRSEMGRDHGAHMEGRAQWAITLVPFDQVLARIVLLQAAPTAQVTWTIRTCGLLRLLVTESDGHLRLVARSPQGTCRHGPGQSAVGHAMPWQSMCCVGVVWCVCVGGFTARADKVLSVRCVGVAGRIPCWRCRRSEERRARRESNSRGGGRRANQRGANRRGRRGNKGGKKGDGDGKKKKFSEVVPAVLSWLLSI